MLILTAFVIFVMLARWQIVHLHDVRDYGNPWFAHLHKGDVLWHRGCRATVIDRKTVDMVIRRDLIGLLYRRPRACTSGAKENKR